MHGVCISCGKLYVVGDLESYVFFQNVVPTENTSDKYCRNLLKPKFHPQLVSIVLRFQKLESRRTTSFIRVKLM